LVARAGSTLIRCYGQEKVPVWRAYWIEGFWKLLDRVQPSRSFQKGARLPALALQYAGVPAGSLIGKIANLIGWVAGILGLLVSLPDFQDLQRRLSAALRSLVP
jgi:hypothetical protein